MNDEKPPVSQGMSLKEFSRLGGLARGKKLKPERRREIASLGGEISAKKKKAKKKNDKDNVKKGN